MDGHLFTLARAVDNNIISETARVLWQKRLCLGSSTRDPISPACKYNTYSRFSIPRILFNTDILKRQRHKKCQLSKDYNDTQCLRPMKESNIMM